MATTTLLQRHAGEGETIAEAIRDCLDSVSYTHLDVYKRQDMPCIVRNLTDDEAITQMVEDNLNQREEILPSERAKALKMCIRDSARTEIQASSLCGAEATVNSTFPVTAFLLM